LLSGLYAVEEEVVHRLIFFTTDETTLVLKNPTQHAVSVCRRQKDVEPLRAGFRLGLLTLVRRAALAHLF